LVWVRPRLWWSDTGARPLATQAYLSYALNMKSASRIKRPRGRPRVGARIPVSTRLSPDVLKAVEAWGRANGSERSESIRRLVELGLTVKGEAKPSTAVRHARRGKADHASSMAGNAIDKLSDQSATTEEQAKRKHRLVGGPSEFRDIRDHTIRKRDT
jgi:hypothetical protein